MREIYTAIDMGSDSIKIVVAEFGDNKFSILASTSVKSIGIKRGLVVDNDMAVNSVNLAIEQIKKILGIKIEKAIVSVPSNDRKLTVVSGRIEIEGKNNTVTGEDITKVLQEATLDKIEKSEELVSIIPITFKVDDKDNITDPKGMKGDYIEVKAVCATVPKKNVYDTLKVFNDCGIEVIDIAFGAIGDYSEAKGKDTKDTLGAIINIGSEITEISVFNKGIIIKNAIINLGSKNVDKDITYIYGINQNTAKELKEKFAVCSRRYADINDYIEVTNNENEKLTINQYEITEVVEARIIELLKLAKKQINDLTKRKISYIIVTGGISELTGFSYLVENTLGLSTSTLNMTTIGIRNNKYSSAFGLIKHFHEKMALRGKQVNMISSNSEDEMMSSKNSMIDLKDDTLISKLFGYFGGN